MRRFIILTLTLCMLVFTASAWAGPGNQRQSGQQYSQRQQTRQSFQQNSPHSQARMGQQQCRQTGQALQHRQGNQHPGMMSQRSMGQGHGWNNQHRMRNPHFQQGHRYQGHDRREVRHNVPVATYRTTTTSSVQGSYQSMGSSQQLSVQVQTTE